MCLIPEDLDIYFPREYRWITEVKAWKYLVTEACEIQRLSRGELLTEAQWGIKLVAKNPDDLLYYLEMWEWQQKQKGLAVVNRFIEPDSVLDITYEYQKDGLRIWTLVYWDDAVILEFHGSKNTQSSSDSSV